MSKVSHDEISGFVREMVRKFSPERVILFGSHASDNTTPGSDVDLLVIMDFDGRPHQQAFKIRKRVRRSFPLDILVRRPEDVERRLNMGDFFLKEVMQKGKVLYERAGSRVDKKSRG